MLNKLHTEDAINKVEKSRLMFSWMTETTEFLGFLANRFILFFQTDCFYL